MPTVSKLLNDVQEHLHDAVRIGEDGDIWTRAELLSWLQDGYRQLLAQSKFTLRLLAMPIPPRHTMAYVHPWERYHVMSGTSRQFTFAGHDNKRQFTTLWELEQLSELTPQAHYTAITQGWELAHVGEVDQHYRFALQRGHDFIMGLWYDHDPLVPITVRELDLLDEAWYRRQGDPLWWTPGTAKGETFEIYYIETADAQSYAIDGLYGTARHASGSRTYAHQTTDGVSHEWAYTTPADVQARRIKRDDFIAQAAYTSSGDVGVTHSALAKQNSAFMPAYQWTIQLAYGRWGTQPWEAPGQSSAVGVQRGQFPWANAHGSLVPEETTKPVGDDILQGAGLRLTKEAPDNYFVTQEWEKERHEGVAEASWSDGATVGTSAFERDYGATNVDDLPVGVPRLITSADRQYWPVEAWQAPLGVARDWQSSEDNLLVWDVVYPHVPDLQDDEQSSPDMLPEQLHKYLRYYVLSAAFNRQGEGYNGGLAAHWEARWMRALRVLNRLRESTWRDQRFRRTPDRRRRGRVPQPQLPPDFPRVPWLNPI